MRLSPYYDRDNITLFNCSHAELVQHLLETLGPECLDSIVTDPPWEATTNEWDVWPVGWPLDVLPVLKASGSMWAIANFQTWWDRSDEFKPGWKVMDDAIWRKHNGSRVVTNQLRRIHEQAVRFHRRDSPASGVYHQKLYTFDAKARTIHRKAQTPHTGKLKPSLYQTEEGGPRHLRSVLDVRSCHGYAWNEAQKPVEFMQPLVEMSCAPGGLTADFFFGSGVTAVIALATGRRFVGCDVREEQCRDAVVALEVLRNNPRMSAHEVMVAVGKAFRAERRAQKRAARLTRRGREPVEQLALLKRNG